MAWRNLFLFFFLSFSIFDSLHDKSSSFALCISKQKFYRACILMKECMTRFAFFSFFRLVNHRIIPAGGNSQTSISITNKSTVGISSAIFIMVWNCSQASIDWFIAFCISMKISTSNHCICCIIIYILCVCVCVCMRFCFWWKIIFFCNL